MRHKWESKSGKSGREGWGGREWRGWDARDVVGEEKRTMVRFGFGFVDGYGGFVYNGGEDFLKMERRRV